jgi:hypothetical protein
MAARKESLLSATKGGGGGGSGSGSREKMLRVVRKFLGWAGRSGFFFLAAAAFMSSLSLLAFRGRALDLDGGREGGGGGVMEEDDFDANGTLTKNAVFKQEVAALLNHSGRVGTLHVRYSAVDMTASVIRVTNLTPPGEWSDNPSRAHGRRHRNDPCNQSSAVGSANSTARAHLPEPESDKEHAALLVRGQRGGQVPHGRAVQVESSCR